MLAILPLSTGAADLIGGTWILQKAGAVIPDAAASDPALNSQIAFWGTIWLGYGVALWWTSRDPIGRASFLRILLGTFFMSGIARAYAAARYGFPGPILAGATVLELGFTPVLALWLDRFAKRHAAQTGRTAGVADERGERDQPKHV